MHFEDENFKDFQNIRLPDCLTYCKWYEEIDRRIIYKDKDSEYNNSHRKIIDRLMELDRLIGVDLRNALCRKLDGHKQDTLMREALLEMHAFLKRPETAEKAIENAGRKCEVCSTQKTFTMDDGKEYMEAHHLIPLSKNTNFDDSLSQSENIICLCPNCHREIHRGRNRLELVEELWNQRKTELKAAGIGIKLSDLKAYYK